MRIKTRIRDEFLQQNNWMNSQKSALVCALVLTTVANGDDQFATTVREGASENISALIEQSSSVDAVGDQETSEKMPASGLNLVEVSVAAPKNDAGTFGIAAYDWDADGRVEIVTNTHDGSHGLNHWEWNGSELSLVGSFKTPRTSSGAHLAIDLRLWAYDANSDGLVDLIADNPNYRPTKVILNSGSGLDFNRGYDAFCGDVDCAPRVLHGNGNYWLIGREGSLFAPGSPRATLEYDPGTSELQGWYIDLKDDGNLQYVDLTSFISSTCSSAHRQHTLNADLDGDGDQDIFMSDAGPGQSHCAPHYIENANGSLVERLGRTPDIMSSVPNYHHAYGMTTADDIDNDGDLDLLVAGNSYDDMYRILLNDGSGNFRRVSTAVDNISRTYPDNNMRPQMIATDFDNDGCRDVVVAIGESPVLRAFRNAACDK